MEMDYTSRVTNSLTLAIVFAREQSHQINQQFNIYKVPPKLLSHVVTPPIRYWKAPPSYYTFLFKISSEMTAVSFTNPQLHCQGHRFDDSADFSLMGERPEGWFGSVIPQFVRKKHCQVWIISLILRKPLDFFSRIWLSNVPSAIPNHPRSQTPPMWAATNATNINPIRRCWIIRSIISDHTLVVAHVSFFERNTPNFSPFFLQKKLPSSGPLFSSILNRSLWVQDQ